MRNPIVLIVWFVVCLLAFNAMYDWLSAQERVTLATPVTAPAVTDYQVRALHLDLGDRSTTDDDSVVVDLEATTGLTTDPNHMRRFTYNGATANQMIVGLNKANLTTRSLNQRILDRLIADGFLSGTVTGTVP